MIRLARVGAQAKRDAPGEAASQIVHDQTMAATISHRQLTALPLKSIAVPLKGEGGVAAHTVRLMNTAMRANRPRPRARRPARNWPRPGTTSEAIAYRIN